MKAAFWVPEKARHPGVFRISTPSVDDIGRIRRRHRNPPSLKSFRKAGLNKYLKLKNTALLTQQQPAGKARLRRFSSCSLYLSEFLTGIVTLTSTRSDKILKTKISSPSSPVIDKLVNGGIPLSAKSGD